MEVVFGMESPSMAYVLDGDFLIVKSAYTGLNASHVSRHLILTSTPILQGRKLRH